MKAQWFRRPLNFFSEKLEEVSEKRSRIYILPTQYGTYFLIIIFILFLISLSYGHSLAFSTTFIFVSLVMTSAHFTNFNLSDLKVIGLQQEFDSLNPRQSTTSVVLENLGKKKRFDIGIQTRAGLKGKLVVDVSGGEKKSIPLHLEGLDRGEYIVDRITLYTTFPFGLFRSWRYFQVTGNFTMYPSLDPKIQELPSSQFADSLAEEGSIGLNQGIEDFDRQEPYQRGMSLRSLNWKSYARGKGLYHKVFVDPVAPSLIFSLNKGKDLESAIREIVSYCLMAERAGLSYKVDLGQPESLEVNLVSTMKVLATWNRRENRV